MTGSPFGYRMGDFAQQVLPLVDSVTMTVIPVGQNRPEIIHVSSYLQVVETN